MSMIETETTVNVTMIVVCIPLLLSFLFSALPFFPRTALFILNVLVFTLSVFRSVL